MSQQSVGALRVEKAGPLATLREVFRHATTTSRCGRTHLQCSRCSRSGSRCGPSWQYWSGSRREGGGRGSLNAQRAAFVQRLVIANIAPSSVTVVPVQKTNIQRISRLLDWEISCLSSAFACAIP